MGEGPHAIIPFLKPTPAFIVDPQGYHWIMNLHRVGQFLQYLLVQFLPTILTVSSVPRTAAVACIQS